MIADGVERVRFADSWMRNPHLENRRARRPTASLKWIFLHSTTRLLGSQRHLSGKRANREFQGRVTPPIGRPAGEGDSNGVPFPSKLCRNSHLVLTVPKKLHGCTPRVCYLLTAHLRRASQCTENSMWPTKTNSTAAAETCTKGQVMRA